MLWSTTSKSTQTHITCCAHYLYALAHAAALGYYLYANDATAAGIDTQFTCAAHSKSLS